MTRKRECCLFPLTVRVHRQKYAIYWCEVPLRDALGGWAKNDLETIQRARFPSGTCRGHWCKNEVNPMRYHMYDAVLTTLRNICMLLDVQPCRSF